MPFGRFIAPSTLQLHGPSDHRRAAPRLLDLPKSTIVPSMPLMIHGAMGMVTMHGDAVVDEEGAEAEAVQDAAVGEATATVAHPAPAPSHPTFHELLDCVYLSSAFVSLRSFE